MRLSDADRERLFDQLSQHAAAGRLGIEELERRVAAITEAETYEQASSVMRDLPPLGDPDPSSGRRRGMRAWGTGHGEASKPSPEWRPTSERFRDPSSNRVMRVWVDGAGGRHYVADDEP